MLTSKIVFQQIFDKTECKIPTVYRSCKWQMLAAIYKYQQCPRLKTQPLTAQCKNLLTKSLVMAVLDTHHRSLICSLKVLSTRSNHKVMELQAQTLEQTQILADKLIMPLLSPTSLAKDPKCVRMFQQCATRLLPSDRPPNQQARTARELANSAASTTQPWTTTKFKWHNR